MSRPDPSSLVVDSYVEYLSSSEFRPILRRLAPSQVVRLVFILVLLCTVILVPVALEQLHRVYRNCDGALRSRMVRAALRSEPLVVHILMANSALCQTHGTIAPALVLGSFEPEYVRDPDVLSQLAMRVMEIGLGAAGGPDEERVERMMADEGCRDGRRRPLPPSMTDGRIVYLFDFQVIGPFLEAGKLDEVSLPALAEPGPHGRIQHLPWWLAPRAA